METLSSDIIRYLRENPHVETMSNRTFANKKKRKKKKKKRERKKEIEKEKE